MKSFITKGENFQPLITFSMNTKEYAIEISKVQQIVRLCEMIQNPQMPDYTKGIIPMMGFMIPIIDLRERFGWEANQYTRFSKAIVVHIHENKVGLALENDSLQVVQVPESLVDSQYSEIDETIRNYLAGVVRMGNKLIHLLNVEEILTPKEILQLRQPNRVK